MSFREKTAWIAVTVTLVVWGYYFTAFWLDVAGLHLDGNVLLMRFIACMAVSFVLMAALAVAIGVIGRKNLGAEPDEMERFIGGHADRIGFRILEALVPVAMIGGLLSVGRIAEAYPADPAGSTALIFANGGLLVIVITELARESVHIVGFRMSA